jgi:hypothetical protein
MGNSVTKRQHYLPRFYLKRFAYCDGRLHVYRRDADSLFLSIPENTCVKSYLYETKMDDETFFQENRIEHRLSEVESGLSELLDELLE